MNPRVKLLTLWTGPLPDYAADFAGRVRDTAALDWELLLFRDAAQVNRLASTRLETPCRKESGYALSDLRPMLAELFPRSVAGYDWWGWVELDVVIGDIDRQLPGVLCRCDAVSFFDTAVSGPLMLLRNESFFNSLFRRGEWRETLAEPSYCNFEEVAGAHVAGSHKDGGFTRVLRDNAPAGRLHWDNRFALRWDKDPARPTPAGCRLEGNRLLETPTGRELLIYHFNHLKRWPVEA